MKNLVRSNSDTELFNTTKDLSEKLNENLVRLKNKAKKFKQSSSK